MGFVDGFYSFFIDLSDSNNGVYETVKIKTAKHPEESYENLHARVIAYILNYSTELSFSQGIYQPKEPTLWEKDVTGTVLRWIEVGLPDKKKVKRALVDYREASHQVVFYSTEQVEQFCHYLKGSKDNWVKDINFTLIEDSFIESLETSSGTREYWGVTITDDALYLTIEERDLETTIVDLDIWSRYQDLIC